MTLGGEKGAVQNPFLRYAEEAGWAYLSPEQAMNLRRGESSPVLDAVFLSQVQRLNQGLLDQNKAEDLLKRLVRVRPSIEGNQDAWEFLKGVKTIFIEAEKRERNVRLIDFQNLEANQFHVTDEFTFSNGVPPNVRADIVFFINGIPIVVSETKAATHAEGIAEAFDDIRYYHRKSPEFLAVSQVHALTHLVQFYYGATWNLSRKALFNWRDEQAGDFETLVKTFVAPRRILRTLSDFILFTRKDDVLEKVILRPHQMRAVERCVQRAKDGTKKRGLIWHTQGSGKTYTMITIAKRLLEDPAFEHPTVIMLIDRTELESQLEGNLRSAGIENFAIAETKKDLRDLLASNRRGLIVSMIHKFDDIPEKVNIGENVFVLVDEAHRTTGGDLGNFLIGALPNATYLGFTGTPIDKTEYGKGTFRVFGADDPKGYLDRYSIRESVEDGTTVPLHYALTPNELLVDRETLEKEFLHLKELEGVSDIEELNKVLERAVTLKNMLKNKERVEKVAQHVAEHFRAVIEPMGYKAFLVGVDREACALYKKALDKHLPADYSAVVMSSAGKKDSEELQKHKLSDDEEKQLRKAFRSPAQDPKILIVTEKLLTGYDAPILYCMYLDKPMRDHVLLQAIARVNRPYEDEAGQRKPAGFVLDFVGIFENLEAALKFDSKDVKGVIEGLDVLKRRFEKLMAEVRSEYLPIVVGKTGDKAAEAVLEHFREKERRQKFYKFFQELEEIYEILSPDAFLRPFIPDYQELTRMYGLLKGSYDRGVLVDKAFLRKTAKLVQEHTLSGDIQAPDKEYRLTAETLEKIAKEQKPDTVKIFNLLKHLDGLVKNQGQHEPYVLSIGERAEQIAKAFEDRQATTQDTLRQLEELLKELSEAEKQRDKTELSPEAFAVFWLLKREGVEQAQDVAKKAQAAFEEQPHWQTSGHQEQAVRTSLYKAFIEAGIDGVVELAQRIMKMLRRDQ